jgi:hypothetical protein
MQFPQKAAARPRAAGIDIAARIVGGQPPLDHADATNCAKAR